MNKILFLPLDERPCNYELPHLLCNITTDYQLIRPSKKILGNKKIPSNFELVKAFLKENASKADTLILSLDQLLYGGIVPSRIHYLSVDTLKERLNIIKEIKNINPFIKIYVFGLVLRCPCYSSDDEEPAYYADCGEEIFNYGVLLSKKTLGVISEEDFELNKKPLLEKIGSNLKDFEDRRIVNRTMIDLFITDYSKYVDYVVIPQDDSEPYGYAMLDRLHVEQTLKENNVKAAMYPGADEVGMTLLARAISYDKNIHPTIKAIYPKEICKELIPLYEAQPVHLTLLKQLEVVGFIYDENSENSIYMNYPTTKCVNMGTEPTKAYFDRDLDKFIELIIDDVKNERKVAICDGAYLNGGEASFLKKIMDEVSLYSLYGYAGWNTSSNSLGTVLANYILAIIYGLNEGHRMFISERVIEDIGFCGHVRWDVWHNYAPAHGYSLDYAGCRNGIVAKEIKRQLDVFISKDFKEVFDNYKILKCQLPWKRLFEVDLKLQKV